MAARPHDSLDWLVGGGEMGKLIRALDWSTTSLGSINTWPQSLRTMVSVCLASNFPISLAWGPGLVQIYNDGYAPICGAKHPRSTRRLRQIVWNLLSNAVKFTPVGGHVEVGLDREGGTVRLRIKDTGEGIPSDLLPLVFDRFRQADSSITRRHGGLGLGLSIVRHLVELHGGEARVESPGKGQGATFTIELPVGALSTEPELTARG